MTNVRGSSTLRSLAVAAFALTLTPYFGLAAWTATTYSEASIVKSVCPRVTVAPSL